MPENLRLDPSTDVSSFDTPVMALFVDLHDCKLQVGSALAAIEHEAFGVGWASADGLAAISTLRLTPQKSHSAMEWPFDRKNLRDR